MKKLFESLKCGIIVALVVSFYILLIGVAFFVLMFLLFCWGIIGGALWIIGGAFITAFIMAYTDF